MRRKTLLLVLLLLAVCALALPACAGAATVAPVTSQDNVILNQTFNVDVTISGNTTNVTAMDFRLNFDKTKLQVVDYAAGNFMTTSLVPALSGADKTTCINWANKDGIIGAGMTGANTVSSGTVLTITFKAIATGQAALDMVTSSLQQNGQNSVVAAAVNSASVFISDQPGTVVGDFTGDNKVNYPDLLRFVKAWNHKSGDAGWSVTDPNISGSPFNVCDIGPATGTYPNIVVNKDGQVNYPDLLVFVNAWKWSIDN